MLPIVGTIRNTVNLAMMDNKWQQKKKSGQIFEKELTPQQQQIKQYQEDLKKMRESNQLASITTKLKSGGILTAEEVEYLQKNNPELYKEYVEIQEEKKAYERELKSCKTKEDVERLRFNKMESLLAQAKSVSNNPNIPEAAKLAFAEKILMKAMGIQEIHMKFVQSEAYRQLPTDEEAAEEERKKAEVKEAVIEEVRENTEEDKETVEELQENTEENTQEDVKSEISDTKSKAEDAFKEIKKEVIQYIKEHRPSGYGMEYLTDDFELREKQK